MAHLIDSATGMDFEFFDMYLTECANRWAEERKFQLETIGQDHAVTELAFRDAVVSQKSERLGKSEKFFWITVNPAKGTSLPDIIRSVTKMYRKKWVTSYTYVYENTADNHIHSHGLIKATYEASRARRECASSVKNICLTSSTNCFKFVELDEEKAKQKMNYMLGKKQSKKMDNVLLTEKWRLDEMLAPFYSSEDLTILLDPREQSEDNVPEISLPDL